MGAGAHRRGRGPGQVARSQNERDHRSAGVDRARIAGKRTPNVHDGWKATCAQASSSIRSDAEGGKALSRAPMTIEIRRAESSDAEAILDVLRAAAEWMRRKGTPAWTAEGIERALNAVLSDGSELLVACCGRAIVGTCMLFRRDPEFWPDAPEGLAAYLHKLAVLRSHAGAGVSASLIAECRSLAREWGCSKLRLDCHPNLSPLYKAAGFTHVDTFYPYEASDFVAERFEADV